MMKGLDIEKKLREIKPYLVQKYYIETIGYFGSYAVGDASDDSDIDILVSFRKPIGWEFFDLEMELEKIFGKKVDLVTKNALKKQLRNRILEQVRYV